MTTTSKLPCEALYNTFGCSHFEHEILEVINQDLAAGRLPNFQRYNLEETNCECRTGNCCWNEAEIVGRLKETGVWAKIEALLHPNRSIETFPNHTLSAHRNSDGSIEVYGIWGTFPYIGNYANYRKMDEAARDMLRLHPMGYVCHVDHNKPEEYVLMLPKGSEYIVIR